MLDDLDKQIIKYLSNGIHSNSELAKLCNAHRNTIMKRVRNLEENGILERRIGGFVNFTKINMSTVIFGMDVNPKDLERTINFLKRQSQVKLLWKTYGTHDLIFAVICDKTDVGICIHKMKVAISKLNINCVKLDSSISISWEKIDLNPY